MATFLKQSTAATLRVGPFVDATDGVTPETGVTLGAADQAEALKASGSTTDISAATFAAITGADGWYDLSLTTSHTDTVGMLTIVIQDASVCLPVFARAMVLPANAYDSLVGGTDVFDVSVTQFGGTAGTFSGGRPEVNTTHAAGTAWNSGAIGASTLASDTITAAKVAADAIGASELAADAVAEIADAIWDEARSGHTTQGTFGEINQAVRSFTAQGGGTNTITLDASASSVDDFYNGGLVWLTKNTGAGQAGVITDYVGATKIATVDNNWRTNPDGTTEGVILPGSLGLTSATLASSVWDAATGAYGTAGTFGKAVSDVLDDTGTAGVVVGSHTTGAKAEINAEADTALSDYGALKPTTAGRTLDVSATGEAGVDWANVGSPTTANALTGTTISSSQVAASVTGAVGSVTGAVGSVTGNVGGNVVGSVASVTGAVGSVTGNVGGNVVGSVASVTAGVALTSSERNSTADAILNRPIDGAGASSRTVLEALAFLRNKWAISGSTLTVYATDDTTALFTATITSASGNPVTSVDPA